MSPMLESIGVACQQLFNGDDHIHVLQPQQTVTEFIRQVTRTKEQQEAFVVLELDDIVHKYSNWKLKLPRVTPFYAVKCNDHPVVLKTLVSLGASFDCASLEEIAKVVALGVKPERIIFANPVKQITHIQYAASVGVNTMTFDNELELHQIKQHHPTAKVVLRVRCDAKQAKVMLGVKFGAQPNEAPGLIALAVELGLELVGVSFHVGSGCEEPEVFDRCIVIGRQLFDLAARQHGVGMTLLDLGGGFPGNKGSSIDTIATVINTSLDHHFPPGCGVKIIAEPGRYFVASAFTVAARVFGRRQVDVNATNGDLSAPSSDPTFFYYINDGVYGNFKNVRLIGLVVKPLVLNQRPGPDYSSSIWGPSCCGLDCVVAQASLPRLEINDWLIFEDMGAYSLVFATRFNGFPFPRVYPAVQQATWRSLIEPSS